METLNIEHPAGGLTDVRLAAATVVSVVMKVGSVNDQLMLGVAELKL
jgi:hypothetical protein